MEFQYVFQKTSSLRRPAGAPAEPAALREALLYPLYITTQQ